MDIKSWDDQLTEEILFIEELLNRIRSMTDPVEKQQAMKRCKARIHNTCGTKRSFQMEIRQVKDVEQRRIYKIRLQQFDQMLHTIQTDYKALESYVSRSTLFEGADTKNRTVQDTTKPGAVLAGDAMLNEANAIQDKTQDAIVNMKRMIDESKETGVLTLEELQRQRQVITKVENETKRVDGNLARSEVLLTKFGRTIAKNHFFQFLIVIFFVNATRYLLEVTSDLFASTLRDATSSVETSSHSLLRGSIEERI
jgi:hypothetical protein